MPPPPPPESDYLPHADPRTGRDILDLLDAIFKKNSRMNRGNYGHSQLYGKYLSEPQYHSSFTDLLNLLICSQCEAPMLHTKSLIKQCPAGHLFCYTCSLRDADCTICQVKGVLSTSRTAIRLREILMDKTLHPHLTKVPQEELPPVAEEPERESEDEDLPDLDGEGRHMDVDSSNKKAADSSDDKPKETSV